MPLKIKCYPFKQLSSTLPDSFSSVGTGVTNCYQLMIAIEGCHTRQNWELEICKQREISTKELFLF